MKSEMVFRAEGLRRSYGGRVVVEDFSATVYRGEIVVLVGPNGCGKTTSVEMGLGLRRTEAGRSLIGGWDVRLESKQAARMTGVALQGASLNMRVRVREHLQFFSAMYRHDSETFDVASLLGLDAQVMQSMYGALSGGLQRRVLVAAALAGMPAFAALDEPTSGVDVESRLALWSALRKVQSHTGMGCLVTTHDLTEAESHADRVLLMNRGRLVGQGPPRELVEQSGLTCVVTVRDTTATLKERVIPTAGVILQSSDAEMRIGFRNNLDGLPLKHWANEQGQTVSMAERQPTFEDAYLCSNAESTDPGGTR